MITAANKTFDLSLALLSGGRRDGGQLVSAPPSYTPFYTTTFSGTLGNTISEFDDPVGTSRYTDEISGPFGASTVMVTDIPTGATGFGGEIINSGLPTVVEGDSVWVRFYLYVPSDFCAAYGASPGDGWGYFKFLRLQWGIAGEGAYSRNTMQLGGLGNQSCSLASASPTIAGSTFESVGGTSNQFLSPGFVLARNTWHAVQMQHYLHSSNGALRFWVDGTMIGEFAGIDTMPSGVANGFSKVVLGDYLNGGLYSAGKLFFDEFIITTEIPNTVDSSGRPYIAPATRVSDFV